MSGASRSPAPARFADALDQVHAIVAAELGTTDFGSADYLPGLRVLLQSMDYDPRFTPLGRELAWNLVIDVLKGRAEAIASMVAHPGFDRAPVIAPVVITGMPRTGTTALHKLLAVDPRFQGLETWLLDAPMPRPPREAWDSYPQFQRTAERLAARYAHAPEKRAAHHMAAEEIDECCLVLRQSFVSNLWSCGWSAASYDAWWQCQDEAPAYAHYRRCVQLIGSDDPNRRWLLKNPGHIDKLDLLFAVFPDARVIQTHRDPVKALPSLAALLIAGYDRIEDAARHEARGRILLTREVAKWSKAVRKAKRVCERHPDQVLDIVHSDFHRDPMTTVERIYAFIGIDLPDDVRAAMARRVAERPEQAHGVHLYAIADFGMTEEQVREPFADYVSQFDLMERRA